MKGGGGATTCPFIPQFLVAGHRFFKNIKNLSNDSNKHRVRRLLTKWSIVSGIFDFDLLFFWISTEKL